MRCLWEYDEIGFTESRPSAVPTNTYTYHLHKMIEDGIIKKKGEKYTLTSAGKRYVEGVFSDEQSKKIDLKIIIHNEKGKVKIISGRLLDSDLRTHAGAIRIVQKKLQCKNPILEHIGDAYITIFNRKGITENTLSHIFELKNPVDISRVGEYLPKEAKEEILFVRDNSDGHFFFERDYLID